MLAVKEIRELAKRLGIEGCEKMDRITLIRAIQVKEGHQPCYGTDWCKPEWSEKCIWKEGCSAEEYFSDFE